ncbi:PAS domain-containing protein [Roseomonas frigidaquae]|uniref:histidine kinase n=1 Tax=Falsiroseomonas frigidaquae TaxID=487318 RepID=A0ABX1EV85_9PROT|nr:ATP-binding protein [Falsiroseomonas frigidaquae]NKE44288.1 PAS domain-containing protein [Falsiroseomonas frigidaquae]
MAQPDEDLGERARLAGESEQLRVALEDAQQEAATLAEDCARLVAELAVRTRRLREVESRLTEREAAAATAQAKLRPQPHKLPGNGDTSDTAESLRVALEELHVIAEELEEANTALADNNAELEERVEARTAELAAINARLRDSEESLRLAQRYAGAGTWDWDIRRNNIVWSAEYFDLYGLDPAVMRPSYAAWVESVVPEDRAAAEAALRDCVANCAPEFSVEYRIRHPRHGLRWLAGRGRLVCDEQGKPLRLIGLNIDITERKQSELALKDANQDLRREVEQEVRAREAAQARLFQTMKLEALGQLTGGVAHDFNNLLSVITSGIALLRTTEDPARREKLVEAMGQAAKRGAELTRRLLSFARRQTLKPQPLDLQLWLEEMRELLARTLRGDITIGIHAAPDIWPVLVDAAELELALLNLGVNARDAMPRGGTLRLMATNVTIGQGDVELAPGDYVEIALSDTGIGMTPDVLARVFEPFYTTKEAGRGTGLGLAQVYGFVRQSNGAARIRSETGGGTTVTLLLPRSLGVPTTPQAAENLLQPTSGMAPLRLLLVEDDTDVGDLTEEVLRHLGHTVSRVDSAQAALSVLKQGLQVDLVMTDVVMPGGQDGLDLARTLRSQRPELPIVLCSGFSGAPLRVAAAGLPLLRKPFGLEELRGALSAAIEGHRPPEMRAS